MDGRTIRGSRDKNQRPIHMISAWAGEQELVSGQMSVAEKKQRDNDSAVAAGVVGHQQLSCDSRCNELSA